MSNSNLISYTKLSPNCYRPRDHKIDVITPHVYVGQSRVETMCDWFSRPSTNASCNYCIGYDGRIALCVDESNGAWTSSNRANDMRAVTIECASDRYHPYAINDAVMKSLIRLMADISKRNNIGTLKWRSDKTLIGKTNLQNITVHRWFKNKACPGDYVYSRLGYITNEANKLLGVSDIVNSETKPNNTSYKTPFSVQVKIPDLNIRSTPTSTIENVVGITGVGVFTIVDVVNGWGKLKSGAGYIWIENPDFCDVLDKEKGFKVYIAIPDLNIRSGPGTNYPKTGAFTGIGTFTIVSVTDGPGSDSGWGKLKSGAGYISLDFVNKI